MGINFMVILAFNDSLELFFLQGGIIVQHRHLMTLKNKN